MHSQALTCSSGWRLLFFVLSITESTALINSSYHNQSLIDEDKENTEREIHKERERHTQRDTLRGRESDRDTERGRETQRETERQRKGVGRERKSKIDCFGSLIPAWK